jgi:hypothetical protein
MNQYLISIDVKNTLKIFNWLLLFLDYERVTCNSENETIALKYIATVIAAEILLQGERTFVRSNKRSLEIFYCNSLKGPRNTLLDFLRHGKNNEILHAQQTKEVLCVFRVRDLFHRNGACAGRVIIG